MSLVVPGIGYTTSLPFPPQVGGNGSNYPLAGERAPDLLERAQRIAAGQQRVPDERFGTDKRTRKDVPRPTGKPSPKRPTKIGETGPNKKTPRPSESPKRPTKPGQVGPNKKSPSRPDKPFTK